MNIAYTFQSLTQHFDLFDYVNRQSLNFHAVFDMRVIGTQENAFHNRFCKGTTRAGFSNQEQGDGKPIFISKFSSIFGFSPPPFLVLNLCGSAGLPCSIAGDLLLRMQRFAEELQPFSRNQSSMRSRAAGRNHFQVSPVPRVKLSRLKPWRLIPLALKLWVIMMKLQACTSAC